MSSVGRSTLAARQSDVTPARAVDPERFLEHVKFLASDDLQGRGNGTAALDRAAEYVARQFRAAGLEPGGERTSFFQPFDIAAGLRVETGNALSIAAAGRSQWLKLGGDYVPLSVGASDAGTPPAAATPLPLAFAGYGIAAPELNYDDYAGVDVTGKAVLVWTHEPQEQLSTSPFDGRTHTRHATIMNKAMVARARGARLLLIVEDPSHASETTRYDGFLRDPQADEYGISVVRVRRDALAPLLTGAIDLDRTHRAIDVDLAPRSSALDRASATLTERFSKVRREVRNVVGVLRGADPRRAGEAIVVGAHYDHLGLGGRHSMSPSAAGEIHNGADDNASGTAALLEIARLAAADRDRFPRTLVFVAFAGEELGLLGSAYYVNHPAVPLDDTVAMINLDMIGRPAGRVLVSGLSSAPSVEADLKAAQALVSLEIKAFSEGAGVGSSDDTSFAVRRIPAVGFFSGFHSDYHRPSDDWQKIDRAGGAQVATLALELTRRLADRADRPAFVAPAAAAHGGATAAPGGGGYGPYFGSVPDFAEDGTGVRFAEVREDSPAARAGLRRGDVLVRFGDVAIKTLYDFTFALREKRPGDKVEVVVLRDGKEIRATVELANRP